MKIKRIILPLSFIIAFNTILLQGCANESSPIGAESLDTSSIISSTTSTLTKEEDLANRFSTDFGSGYGKELEDAWKSDKSNIQISAMYHYYNALFYEANNQTDMAKDSMSNISADYAGIMSDKIVSHGIQLFGSKDAWTKSTGTKNDDNNKLNDSKRQEIKNWITERYDYYDKKEGKYCGDKYTKTIFQEAADKFGLTYQEIDNIWAGLS